MESPAKERSSLQGPAEEMYEETGDRGVWPGVCVADGGLTLVMEGALKVLRRWCVLVVRRPATSTSVGGGPAAFKSG